MVVLTEQMLLQRGGALETLKTVNLWGAELSDISILRRCPSLEVVSLAQNLICDISPLSACKKLREVYLRRNALGPGLECLFPLACLPELRIVWLDDNECARDPRYRALVVRLCSKSPLEKIDTVTVGEAERKQAHAGDDAVLEEAVRRCVLLAGGGGGAAGAAAAPQRPPTGQATHWSLSPMQQAPPPTRASGVVPVPTLSVAHEGVVGPAASSASSRVAASTAAAPSSFVLQAALMLVRELAATPGSAYELERLAGAARDAFLAAASRAK